MLRYFYQDNSSIISNGKVHNEVVNTIKKYLILN